MMKRESKSTEQGTRPNQTFTLNPQPFPILKAGVLLNDKKIERILARLEKVANVPADHFQALYIKTIHNYAEFVQELPASHVRGFNHSRGLLVLGLERALNALILYRKEFPLKGIKPDDMSRRWALYTYGIFTAALFYGVGQVLATYIVYLSDKRGVQGERWVATTGPMTKTKYTHYRFVFDSVNRDALAARAASVLAQLLMPKIGFDWLASDINVFDYWLAILQNDEAHGGLFAKMILIAQREAIENYAALAQASVHMHQMDENAELGAEKEETQTLDETAEEKTKNADVEHKESVGSKLVIPGVSPGAEITANSIIGAQGGELMLQLFLNWLRIAVFKNPYFSINNANSNVIVNHQGIFIRGQELIQQFMRDANIKANIGEVVQALQKKTVSVVRQKTSSGSQTYFVVQDLTKVINGEHLPAVQKSMNVPNITNLQSTYPGLPKQNLLHRFTPTGKPS